MLDLVVLGYVSGTPVLQYTAEGVAVIRFFTEVYEAQGGDYPPEYFRFYVTLLGEKAEALNNTLTESAPVVVRGALKQQDGNPRIFYRKADNSPYSVYEIDALAVDAIAGQVVPDAQSAFGFVKLALIGRLTADLELRYTPSGKAVCDLRLAVNAYIDGKDQVYWFKTTTWGKAAETHSKNLAKGRQEMRHAEESHTVDTALKGIKALSMPTNGNGSS